MNPEELKYIPHLTAALNAKGYPADASLLIMESPWVSFVVGDAWRNHVPLENAAGWFGRRWLAGPMRCLWLWQPNMELDSLPQDVARRAEEAMKRRKTPASSGYGVPNPEASAYRKPSR